VSQGRQACPVGFPRPGSASEDGVDKRSQRLDACREDQHESDYSQEYGQRQLPAFGRAALPHTSCEVGDRSARTADYDQTASYPATLLEHVMVSFCVVSAARFATRVQPAINTSIPLRRKVE
jgi:hypothetical protein